MRRLATGAVCLLLLPVTASAQQVFEAIGSRALGMAGAFVAVADDPSATYWNPAGLAAAGPAAATIEWVRFQTGNQKQATAPGPSRRSASFVCLGTWPIGLSFTKQQSSALVSQPSGAVWTQAFDTSDTAVTLLQSLTEGLVIATTLKYVRGTVVSNPAQEPITGDALAAASVEGGKSEGHFDYDLALMVDMKKLRIGWTIKNLRRSTFSDATGVSVSLRRQSRAGVAFLPNNGLTLAIDVDLDTAALTDGLRRMIALGGEKRLGQRFVMRGGIRMSLRGPRRQVVAVGASVALRQHAWLDGHYSQGRLDADRGFGLALRAGY